MKTIKDLIFGIKKNLDAEIVEDFLTGDEQDRITTKQLEQIFKGYLPPDACEFLLKPPCGRPVYVTRGILESMADGSYPDLVSIDGWDAHDEGKIKPKMEVHAPIHESIDMEPPPRPEPSLPLKKGG